MNIFVLDLDCKICARYHCDKHVSKMILESAQMLSTAVMRHNPLAKDLYRSFNKNHPCCVWAAKNKSNFVWLYNLSKELGVEYSYRYGKFHKSLAVIDNCFSYIDCIPDGELTPFAQAMPDKYRNTNPVTAYRDYYIGEKFDIAKYTKREFPFWLKKIT